MAERSAAHQVASRSGSAPRTFRTPPAPQVRRPTGRLDPRRSGRTDEQRQMPAQTFCARTGRLINAAACQVAGRSGSECSVQIARASGLPRRPGSKTACGFGGHRIRWWFLACGGRPAPQVRRPIGRPDPHRSGRTTDGRLFLRTVALPFEASFWRMMNAWSVRLKTTEAGGSSEPICEGMNPPRSDEGAERGM